MASLENLLEHYRRYAALPWQSGLPGERRVWLLWYDKVLERRVRGRIHLFEEATRRAGHGWSLLDLSRDFAEWLSAHEYRDGLFEEPEEIAGPLPDFHRHLVARLRGALADSGPNDVVAVTGVASLFGLTRVSALIEPVAPEIPGRLLVFFPGRHAAGVYRLLDARDGWNYLAIPIPATEAE